MKYFVFLRGINVGGNKKVPMAELKTLLEESGFHTIKTLLNSGNIILETNAADDQKLENELENLLSAHFGFTIPVIVRRADDIEALYETDPFEGIPITKNTRLYISLLKSDVPENLQLPWVSEDNSYRILRKRGKDIVSVLELGEKNTIDAMKILEQSYGKAITTRNWNTIEKMVK